MIIDSSIRTAMKPLFRHRATAGLLASLGSLGGAPAYGQTPAAAPPPVAPAPSAAHRPPPGMAAVTPFRAGERYFVASQDGALYVGDRTGDYRLLLPAAAVPYTIIAPSPDGRYVAYGLAARGSAGRTYDVHVRDVATGQDLPGVLHNAAITTKPWTRDGRGFFYARGDATESRERVYYHRAGDSQGRDRLVFSEFSHPEFRYDVQVSDDGQYAVFTISHPADAKTAVYFLDVGDPKKPRFDAPVVRLVDSFGARYDFVDDAGTYFILQTDRAAPRGQLVLADINVTRESEWPVVLPEQRDTLRFARTAGEQYVIAVYSNGLAPGSRVQVLGPPDPRVVEAELRQRLDSIRRARRGGGRQQGAPPPISEPMAGRPTLRLVQRSELALPPRGVVLDMHTVADQPEVFYTVRWADGTVRAYRYDVRTGTPALFEPRLTPPATAPSAAAAARP